MSIPVIVFKGGRKRLKQGHLWIFRDEITGSTDGLSAGDIVRVHTDYGYDCGLGFFHPTSQIAVRLLHCFDEELTQEFIRQRLHNAQKLRERFFPSCTAYRLSFGESDFLPGLILDRYNDYFSMQILSAGMEKNKSLIINSLLELFPSTKGIIEKNDSRTRDLEGLPRNEEFIWGALADNIIIEENGILLNISLEHGQKTGYFFDQRLNRAAVANLSDGLKVLDCFTNQGGFALNAAKAGAVEALGIDISASAIEQCKLNAETNKLSNAKFIKADVFEILKEKAHSGEKWDMVILDPPAFTKSKHTIPQAKRGYSDINRQALKLIEKGGFLVSSSCSHHISEEMFLSIIQDEAQRINRKLKLVWRGMQSPDHPILLGMPETAYLKFLIFEVW